MPCEAARKFRSVLLGLLCVTSLFSLLPQPYPMEKVLVCKNMPTIIHTGTFVKLFHGRGYDEVSRRVLENMEFPPV